MPADTTLALKNKIFLVMTDIFLLSNQAIKMLIHKTTSYPVYTFENKDKKSKFSK